MFTEYPLYSPYRTLLYVPDYPLRGEDVYALQTILTDMGFDTGGQDGIFGRKTRDAVKQAQTVLQITADGKAGGQTWQFAVKRYSNEVRDRHKLPINLVYGQVMHESSTRGGNYSAPHSWGMTGANFVVDGQRCAADLGVAQQNSRFTEPVHAFNVPDSIDKLGLFLESYHRLFAGVTNTRRRWELAAGAWNAPAWACKVAKDSGATFTSKPTWWPTELTWVGPSRYAPTGDNRTNWEQYMKSATAYMIL